MTPLRNLPIYITSSNPDVLKASISTNQRSIMLEGLKIGTSVLSVILGDRNVYDSIAVSVGSLIHPSYDVWILRHGTVKYSLPGSSAGKWQSSDPNVATINEKTGEATAIAKGKTKITNGNTFGWLHVTPV